VIAALLLTAALAGQPEPPAPIAVTEPAVVVTTEAPLPDECLDLGDGIGQTRWGLVSCELSTVTVAAPPPVPTLPVTGASTEQVAWGVVLLVAGFALVYFRTIKER